jgi:hypothetical protein
VARACGPCSLCCTLLRVDELGKPGGAPCVHQRAGRAGGACAIHPDRPGVCRAYRCLWLAGGLADADRPDRLGAMLDLLSEGGAAVLVIREARAGAFDGSPRLREIAESYRATLPVRVVEAGDPWDPDRPFRLLLPGGEEQRVRGERVTVLRGGVPVAERRLPWLDRVWRRAVLAARRGRLRRLRPPAGER